MASFSPEHLAIVEALLSLIRRLVPRLPCDRDMHCKAPAIDACEGISTNEEFRVRERIDKAKRRVAENSTRGKTSAKYM